VPSWLRSAGELHEPIDGEVDFTKIRSQVPSFQPIWTVPQGIKEIWTDAGERGLTTENFEGPVMCGCVRFSGWPKRGRLDLTDLSDLGDLALGRWTAGGGA
jgi:hypothetical protein